MERASARDKLFLVAVVIGTLTLWPIAAIVRRVSRRRSYLMR